MISLAGSINLFDPNPEFVATLPLATQTQHGLAIHPHFRLETHQVSANAHLVVVYPTVAPWAFNQRDEQMLARSLDLANETSGEITPWALESGRLAIPTLRQRQAVVYVGARNNLHFAGNLSINAAGRFNVLGLQRLFQTGLLAEHAPVQPQGDVAPSFTHEVVNQGSGRKIVFRPGTGDINITPADQAEIARLLDEANGYYRALGNLDWHITSAGQIVEGLRRGKASVYYGIPGSMHFRGFEGVMNARSQR